MAGDSYIIGERVKQRERKNLLAGNSKYAGFSLLALDVDSLENGLNERSSSSTSCYTPLELRAPFLIFFAIVVLALCVPLLIFASTLMPRQALVPRTASATTVGTEPSNGTAPGTTFTEGDIANNTSPTPANNTSPAPGSFSNPFNRHDGWTPSYYFVGAYLPTFTAILLNIYWKCVYTRLKEMEPVYQLTKKDGSVTANDTILLTYRSQNVYRVFLSSLFNRHWFTWLGTLNSLLLLTCTAFASETIYISTSGSACRVIVNPEASTNNECTMQLSLRPSLAYALGTAFLIVSAVTVLLAIRIACKPSGIFAEVSSIAGMASLYPELTARGMLDSSESLPDVHQRRHGVPGEVKSAVITAQPASRLLPGQQTPRAGPRRGTQGILFHPVVLAMFLLYLAAVMTMILYYRFASKPGTNDAFEDFMNSQSFGVRFFTTCIGLIIKGYLGMLEAHVRSLAPYAAMSSPGGATADRTILVRSPSHPIAGLFDRSS